MARVNTQDIPPELAALYRETLGATREAFPRGSEHPGSDEAVTKKYPPHLEPPHIPTALQIQERSYFLHCVNCFKAMPLNERRAYWRLSQGSGLGYFNYYLSETIPIAVTGKVCSDWSKPKVLSLQTEWSCTAGGVFIHLPTTGAYDLLYEIESDPAPLGTQPYNCTSAPLSIVQNFFDWEDYTWKCNVLKNFPDDFVERSEWLDTLNIPAISEQPQPLWRDIIFWRNSDVISQTAVWTFEIGDPPLQVQGWNFD